jgi:hypothetical protein
VPVSLCGTRDVLRDGSWRPQLAPLSVAVSEPVQPEGEGWHGMLALRDRVRDAILEHCGEPSLDDHRGVAASPVPQAPSGSSGKVAR